jgi:allantoinase
MLERCKVTNSYLQYHRLRYGMDHDRYDYSALQTRRPILWPESKPVALLIVVCAQVFPLNQRGVPFKVPGGMSTPYPDLRHASLRDYGNRVGIYRVLDALEKFHLKACYALNSALIDVAPSLVKVLAARGEILCHGKDMDALHHNGLDVDTERAQIVGPLARLSAATGQRIAGWLSPAKNQSERTPDLLKAAGVRYCLDWVNDELAYQQRTDSGPLWALPLSTELDDQFVIMSNQHSEQSWHEQVLDAFRFLTQEARETGHGRMLTLTLHPWLIGQPHRIAWLERTLGAICEAGGYWNASGTEIIDLNERAL